jgi:hypothetical protein
MIRVSGCLDHVSILPWLFPSVSPSIKLGPGYRAGGAVERHTSRQGEAPQPRLLGEVPAQVLHGPVEAALESGEEPHAASL